MLYFSKTKIFLITIVTLIFVYLTSSNFLKFDDNWIRQNINLGLDLQGGSYLLLEVDSTPLIKQKLQGKLLDLRKFLKEKKIKYTNLKIDNNSIVFNMLNPSPIT